MDVSGDWFLDWLDQAEVTSLPPAKTSLGQQPRWHVLIKQMLEDWSEVGASDLAFPDIDPSEDTLVEVATAEVIVGHVVLVSHGEEVSAALKRSVKSVDLEVCLRKSALMRDL